MKIYQDLDGCLANFVKSIISQITIISKTEDISKISSATLRRGVRRYLKEFDKDTILTQADLDHKLVRPLLYRLASEKNFFYDLEIMPNGLWDFIKDYEHEVLTASVGEHAVEDKTRWVREKLNSDVPVHVVHKKALKLLHCEDGDVLIDDHKGTIDQWNDLGGNGFLWTGKAGGDVAALKVFLDNLGLSTK